MPNAEAEVRERVKDILDAAEKKDFDRLDSYHLFSAQFSKFGTVGATREDAETARKSEHDSLAAATGLEMRADDLKIDVFGDAAVATCLLKSSVMTATGRSEKPARATFVLVNDRGSWKIVHEHLSRVP